MRSPASECARAFAVVAAVAPLVWAAVAAVVPLVFAAPAFGADATATASVRRQPVNDRTCFINVSATKAWRISLAPRFIAGFERPQKHRKPF